MKRPGAELPVGVQPSPSKKPKVALDYVDAADVKGDVLMSVPILTLKGGSAQLLIMTQNKVLCLATFVDRNCTAANRPFFFGAHGV